MTRSDLRAIEGRLRLALSVPLESLRDGVDMTPAAVTRRLRDACEMSALCLALTGSSDMEGAARR